MTSSVQPSTRPRGTVGEDAVEEVLGNRDWMTLIIAMPRLDKAIVEVAAVAGLTTFTASATVRGAYRQEERTYGVAPLADGRCGSFTVSPSMQAVWSRSQPVFLDPRSEDWGRRMAALRDGMKALLNSAIDMREVLADAMDDDAQSRAFRTAVLQAWWHARLAEGYPADGARTMLALVAHPTLLAVVDWREDGTPALR